MKGFGEGSKAPALSAPAKKYPEPSIMPKRTRIMQTLGWTDDLGTEHMVRARLVTDPKGYYALDEVVKSDNSGRVIASTSTHKIDIRAFHPGGEQYQNKEFFTLEEVASIMMNYERMNVEERMGAELLQSHREALGLLYYRTALLKNEALALDEKEGKLVPIENGLIVGRGTFSADTVELAAALDAEPDVSGHLNAMTELLGTAMSSGEMEAYFEAMKTRQIWSFETEETINEYRNQSLAISMIKGILVRTQKYEAQDPSDFKAIVRELNTLTEEIKKIEHDALKGTGYVSAQDVGVFEPYKLEDIPENEALVKQKKAGPADSASFAQFMDARIARERAYKGLRNYAAQYAKLVLICFLAQRLKVAADWCAQHPEEKNSWEIFRKNYHEGDIDGIPFSIYRHYPSRVGLNKIRSGYRGYTSVEADKFLDLYKVVVADALEFAEKLGADTVTLSKLRSICATSYRPELDFSQLMARLDQFTGEADSMVKALTKQKEQVLKPKSP